MENRIKTQISPLKNSCTAVTENWIRHYLKQKQAVLVFHPVSLKSKNLHFLAARGRGRPPPFSGLFRQEYHFSFTCSQVYKFHLKISYQLDVFSNYEIMI